MNFDGKRLERTLNHTSKEYASIIRQIWKEGRERATHSVMEARKMDIEKRRAAAKKALTAKAAKAAMENSMGRAPKEHPGVHPDV